MNRSHRALRVRIDALTTLLVLTLGMSLGMRPAAAQPPAPVSSQPMLAIEIPNTATFWPKVAALPPVQGLTAFFQSPAMTSDLGYREFTLAVDKLSQSLGYPATMQEFFCNVFSRAMLFVSTGASSPEPDVALAFGVKDSQKAARLIQVFDKKYQDESTSPTASPGGAPGGAVAAFEKVKLEDVVVSHYTEPGMAGERPREGYYGLVKDRLIYATTPDAFTRAVHREPTLAPALASDADFNALRAPLAWEDADLTAWIDGDAFAQVASGGLGPLAALAHSNPKFKNKWAIVLQARPDGVVTKMTGTANPSLQSANIQPAQLKGPALFGSQPILAIDSRVFDLGVMVEQLRPMLTMMSAMQGTAGGKGSPLEQFEQSTGISVDGELVPAVGNEFLLAFNAMQPNPANPLVPLLDLVLGLEIADETKMAAVMGKLEKFIEQGAGAVRAGPVATAPGAAATSVTFQTVEADGAKIRSISSGMPGISPGYTIHQGLLLVGLNAENIRTALARKSGASPSLTADAGYRDIMAITGNPPLFAYTTVDMERLVTQVLTPLAGIVAMQKPGANLQAINQVLTQIVARVGVGHGIAYNEKGVYTSLVKIKMQ